MQIPKEIFQKLMRLNRKYYTMKAKRIGYIGFSDTIDSTFDNESINIIILNNKTMEINKNIPYKLGSTK